MIKKYLLLFITKLMSPQEMASSRELISPTSNIDLDLNFLRQAVIRLQSDLSLHSFNLRDLDRSNHIKQIALFNRIEALEWSKRELNVLSLADTKIENYRQEQRVSLQLQDYRINYLEKNLEKNRDSFDKFKWEQLVLQKNLETHLFKRLSAQHIKSVNIFFDRMISYNFESFRLFLEDSKLKDVQHRINTIEQEVYHIKEQLDNFLVDQRKHSENVKTSKTKSDSNFLCELPTDVSTFVTQLSVFDVKNLSDEDIDFLLNKIEARKQLKALKSNQNQNFVTKEVFDQFKEEISLLKKSLEDSNLANSSLKFENFESLLSQEQKIPSCQSNFENSSLLNLLSPKTLYHF